MKYLYCFIFCSLLLFVGCMSKEQEIGEALKEFESKPIELPFSKMLCWKDGTLQSIRPWENAEMKLVVYIDSTNCSECTLKKLYMWEDFVEMERQYNDRFFIFFIFQKPANVNVSTLASTFKISELNHPMYIDAKSELTRINPNIPRESIFHTFLLDKNNNVILVGEPLFHPQIEKMLRGYVHEGLR